MDLSDKLLVLLLLLALIAAGFLAAGRLHIEAANRTVEIILDADDVRQLAAASGRSPDDVLVELRSAGATALAVKELTIEELIALARLLPAAAAHGAAFLSPDTELLALLSAAIRAKLPRAEVQFIGGETPRVLVRGVAYDQLAALPVLLRVEDLRAARAADLRLVARLTNFAFASPLAIQAAAAQAEAAGATLVIFAEDQVLGFPDLLREAAAALQEHDLLYGYVEMVGQKGDLSLAGMTPTRFVRVHSITDADMQTITPSVAISRYQRAVHERSIRACYLRLILRPQPDPLERNVAYLRSVVGGLRSRGFTTGPAAPLAAPQGWPPRWARLIALSGLPAALVLLVRRLLPLRTAHAWILFAAAIALGGLIGLSRRPLLTPISGLAAACIFPSLAVLWVLDWSRGMRLRLRSWAAAGRALIALLGACLISLAGALLMVGIHSHIAYLSGAARFTGVKLSYVAPLFLILAAAIAGSRARAASPPHWWATVRVRLLQSFSHPITVAQAAVVAIVLGAVAFAVSRSGNQPALAPSAIELKARSLLESLLVIRPRTKEFLFGHPGLMLYVALSLRGRRTWLPLLAVLAGVGQVSLVNTFCHFHSPLLVGLIRTGNGIWLGALLGVATIILWRILLDRPPRPSGP